MRRARGFTLLELLVVLVVVVIMASVAVPGFQRTIAVNRMAADFNAVLTGLNYARSEAIKRRAEVTFEVTEDRPWVYRVKVDDEVLRERRGQNARTSLSKLSLSFDHLGKPVTGSNCPVECRLTLSSSHDGIEDRMLEVSRQGRVGRRSGDDEN